MSKSPIVFHSVPEVMESLKGAKRIVTAMAAAEPEGFFQHLSGPTGKHLQGSRVYCANPTAAYDCLSENGKELGIEFMMMFLTAHVRNHQSHGHIFYVPQHLSQWVDHLIQHDPIDVFWGVCTPPDDRGFVSLGPGACYESQIRRKARKVVLEVNPDLPMTFGDTHVGVSEVDFFIDHPREVPTIPRNLPMDVDHSIADHIAPLIPDGATLQLGIGGIPDALGKALAKKRDLGIHTEMINDTMMDLYLSGAVTGRAKTLWPGKIVGSFALGTKNLYDFIDKNPVVELQPSSVVNDPYRIGRNHNMVSINTAVELDFTGQVCSESVGHRELSGVGGASETHIGAQRSKGGRGIIALRSTTKQGTSKIVSSLTPGAKVSISRNDVDTVVTEHGIAELKGCSVKERVLALISIAAPEFRQNLLEDARKWHYV